MVGGKRFNVPKAFMIPTVKRQNTTAKTTARACLTFAATVIASAPTFLFAAKLARFNPNAIAPLTISTVISWLPNFPESNAYCRNASVSPLKYAIERLCNKASGHMR